MICYEVCFSTEDDLTYGHKLLENVGSLTGFYSKAFELLIYYVLYAVSGLHTKRTVPELHFV